MRRTMALIAAFVLVGGCGTSESSLSDTIEGVWVTDLYGIFERYVDDRGRVRILLSLIGYQASVEMEAEQLEKL